MFTAGQFARCPALNEPPEALTAEQIKEHNWEQTKCRGKHKTQSSVSHHSLSVPAASLVLYNRAKRSRRTLLYFFLDEELVKFPTHCFSTFYKANIIVKRTRVACFILSWSIFFQPIRVGIISELYYNIASVLTQALHSDMLQVARSHTLYSFFWRFLYTLRNEVNFDSFLKVPLSCYKPRKTWYWK